MPTRSVPAISVKHTNSKQTTLLTADPQPCVCIIAGPCWTLLPPIMQGFVACSLNPPVSNQTILQSGAAEKACSGVGLLDSKESKLCVEKRAHAATAAQGEREVEAYLAASASTLPAPSTCLPSKQLRSTWRLPKVSTTSHLFLPLSCGGKGCLVHAVGTLHSYLSSLCLHHTCVLQHLHSCRAMLIWALC